MIFLLLDVRRIPSAEDLQMQHGRRRRESTSAFCTKSDKLSNAGIAKQKAAIAAALAVDPDILIADLGGNKEGYRRGRGARS